MVKKLLQKLRKGCSNFVKIDDWIINNMFAVVIPIKKHGAASMRVKEVNVSFNLNLYVHYIIFS